MDLTPERRRCLEAVATAGGALSHDAQQLAEFCDDESTLTAPDVFNQCHDAGWLYSMHDSDLSSSVVRLTHEGRAALQLSQNQG